MVGRVAESAVGRQVRIERRRPIGLPRADWRIRLALDYRLRQFGAQNRRQLTVGRALPHQPFRNENITRATMEDLRLRRPDGAKHDRHLALAEA